MKKVALPLLTIFLFLTSTIPHVQAAISVTAQSGSVADIQTAVNQVAAAGGGTVYIPAGTWLFNATPHYRLEIPGGVNIFGDANPPPQGQKGNGTIRTILKLPEEEPDPSFPSSEFRTTMFNVHGENGLPVRISGIHFIGRVDPDEFPGNWWTSTGDTGIKFSRVKDFRVDNCRFEGMGGSGVSVNDDEVSGTVESQGVVDHCSFINLYKIYCLNPERSSIPYADTSSRGYAYGVAVRKAYVLADCPWEPDISKILGKYDGNVYIEDSFFTGCRHNVMNFAGGIYVARHNIMHNGPAKCTYNISAAFHMIDQHPARTATNAGRSMEIYGNQIYQDHPTNYPPGVPHHRIMGLSTEGGGGVVYNNTFGPNLGTCISMGCPETDDPTLVERCKINDFYIWDNTFTESGTSISVQSCTREQPVENEHYFLRPPNLAEDGLEYTPYPYPHPLTIEPSSKYRIWGRLLDANSLPVQSEVSAFIEGTGTIITSNQTDANGDYGLEVQPGTYDIQYRILTPGFYVPNFLLRFYSINVNSTFQNLVKSITQYPTNKKIVLVINSTPRQTIHTYSHIKPTRMRINGTVFPEVGSISDLSDNTWYYDEANKILHMIINPLSIPQITKLHVEGKYLKDENGNTVILRGINHPGWVDDPTGAWRCEGCGIWGGIHTWDPEAVKANLDAMSHDWGMNVMRLHTSIDYWKTDNSSFRQHIKDTIRWAGERGMYVIYDTYSIFYYPKGYQPNLPFPPYITPEEETVISSEQDFIDFWIDVATELKDYPNVIFEINNEPHGDDTAKERYFSVSQTIINELRARGIDHPIIIQWGYGVWANLDYSGGAFMDWVEEHPLADSAGNLVYSTHIYRNGGFCHRSSTVPSDQRDRWQYDEMMLCLNRTLVNHVANTLNKPLVIGEIGANYWLYSNTTRFEWELAYLNNTLFIFNDWGVGYIGWVWTVPAHMMHGMLQNGVWIPPANEVGQIFIDKIAEAKSS